MDKTGIDTAWRLGFPRRPCRCESDPFRNQASPAPFSVPPGEPGAGGTQAPGAEEKSRKLDMRACVQLSGGGGFFGVETGG